MSAEEAFNVLVEGIIEVVGRRIDWDIEMLGDSLLKVTSQQRILSWELKSALAFTVSGILFLSSCPSSFFLRDSLVLLWDQRRFSAGVLLIGVALTAGIVQDFLINIHFGDHALSPALPYSCPWQQVHLIHPGPISEPAEQKSVDVRACRTCALDLLLQCGRVVQPIEGAADDVIELTKQVDADEGDLVPSRAIGHGDEDVEEQEEGGHPDEQLR